MRISIRGKTATILKSDGSDEVAIIITDINKEDLINAYYSIDTAINMEMEEMDELELPEDFRIK